ncbi:hypothetical protein CR513_01283, partial [Mucuna pruriens]
MKAFPFSLDGAAKDCIYLQPVLFNTWGDMKHIFLDKFFPASRTATIKKGICGIRQHSGETLHEYWERFNKLCATCPHHQISEQLLIQYFYEGLTMMERSMIDATSRGALMDNTPATTRHLISNMASNTQQFRIKGTSQLRMVNEIGVIDNLRLENQLTELTSLPEFVAYVLSWNTPLICAPHCKKLSRTNQRVLEQYVDISTRSSRIRVGHLIINSLESNHFGQGRVKGYM